MHIKANCRVVHMNECVSMTDKHGTSDKEYIVPYVTDQKNYLEFSHNPGLNEYIMYAASLNVLSYLADHID